MSQGTQGLRPVLVHWLDSMTHEGWEEYDHMAASEICVVTTVGHLYKETAEAVVIAQSRTGDVYGTYITIPRVAVTSIVVLSLPSAHKRSASSLRRAP